MKKLTDLVMDKIADALSAKATFLIFIIVAVLPLFFQMPHDLLGWQQWGSQTFIQLVALNVLAVVSKKESRVQQKLIQEMHDAIIQEFTMLKEDLMLAQEERAVSEESLRLQRLEQKEMRELLQAIALKGA